MKHSNDAPNDEIAPGVVAPEVQGAQALMRGLDVLMAIGLAPRPPRFRDLSAAVQIPKGTLHRLLSALQRRRLVRYDERTRQYHVGSRVFDLARRTLDQSQVIRAAKPELSRLARQLNHTVCLYVLDGADVFVLDFEDPDTAQAHMVRIWPRRAVAESAAGLAMVAAMRPEDRQMFAGPTDEAGLKELDIGLGQALGYTISRAEIGNVPEIAAAIIGDDGYPVAAICCPYDGDAITAEEAHDAGRVIAEGALRASGNVAGPYGILAVLPMAPQAIDLRVENLQTGRDFMGENPVWCHRRKKLFWLDILAPSLRSFDPATGLSERTSLPEITGGLALTTDDRLILLGQKGVFSFEPRTGEETLLLNPEADRPDNRFNTAAVDASGAIWAGTMAISQQPERGSLYQLRADLSVRRALERVGAPKNAGWSPDGRIMYMSDGGTVAAFAFDTATGQLGARTTLMSGNSDIGMPNGLTVDSEGCVWVAMLGGWAVHRYGPDGSQLEAIHLPVPMPTSLAFGGEDLKTLFITTTYLRLPPGFSTLAPASGNLFALRTSVAGQVPNLFGKNARP